MSLRMNIEFGEGKHILCRYKDLKNHLDPRFDELTYGEGGHLSTMVRKNIKAGSHYFFHKTINGQRYITAHYFVTKVMEGYDARHDQKIRNKYKNIHLHPPYAPEKETRGEKRDIIIFGDEEKSLGELKPPLLFDRKLAEKLELEGGKKLKFDIVDKNGKKWTDTECLGACTHSPRYITEKDVITLLNAINLRDMNSPPDDIQLGSPIRESGLNKILNEEEHPYSSKFAQALDFSESIIEQFITKNPELLEEGMKKIENQLTVHSGRIDLLLETKTGDLILLEVKAGLPKDDVVTQVLSYVDDVKSLYPSRNVIPSILSCGCSERIINAARNTGIRIYNYWAFIGTSRIL